jgi:hypothetical protein
MMIIKLSLKRLGFKMRKVWHYFMAFCGDGGERLGTITGITEKRGV